MTPPAPVSIPRVRPLPRRPRAARVVAVVAGAALWSAVGCNTTEYQRGRAEAAAAQQQERADRARAAYQRQQMQPYHAEAK